jgi:hypothetical protein
LAQDQENGGAGPRWLSRSHRAFPAPILVHCYCTGVTPAAGLQQVQDTGDVEDPRDPTVSVDHAQHNPLLGGFTLGV